MTFGDRLRKLRKQHDMTQEQVAKKLNIVRSTYAYYETGKTSPDFNTIIHLARLFNVTTDYLLAAGPATATDNVNPNTPISKTANASGTDWSLRESEQRLLIAFRYLDKHLQKAILESIEESAAEIYEQRRKQRRDKD